MSGIFNGLHIGLTGLQTQRKSLDVAGHNVANANNEEYSRQRAVQTATEPYPVPSLTSPGGAGQLGTGVKVAEIERIRDEFIEGQIRQESQEMGKWDKLYQGLHRIESVLKEPSDSGLNSVLSRFWQSLQDLSNSPEDPATRSTVQQRAISLTDTFHSLNEQLTDYKKSLNRDVFSTVNNINSLTRRIADLNRQITAIEYSGQKPNDLMDKRDGLFKELSETVNVRGKIDQYGNLNISLGGTNLVNKANINELKVEGDVEADVRYENEVQFKDTGEEVRINSGKLKGIIQTRDENIDNYIDELDTLAEGLAARFNEVHRSGYDLNGEAGEDFFIIASDDDRSPSAVIRLSEAIKRDDTKIAAGYVNDNPEVVTVDSVSTRSDYSYQIDVSENDDPASELLVTIREMDGAFAVNTEEDIEIDAGDNITLSTVPGFSADFTVTINETGTANLGWERGSGDNAVRLADAIKKDKVIGEDDDTSASITEHYQSVIATLGVDGERAQQMKASQGDLVNQLQNQRESISGVSLDEEMTNIIKYQQAYNAASKIITTTEKLLDNLMQIIR